VSGVLRDSGAFDVGVESFEVLDVPGEHRFLGELGRGLDGDVACLDQIVGIRWGDDEAVVRLLMGGYAVGLDIRQQGLVEERSDGE
jgi:hypothetical protein